jgi:nucleotide-binding universal stress UspA family protein
VVDSLSWESIVSTPPAAAQRAGPVVIGYDGSPVADRALAEAAGLLAPRSALVVVVWEAGRAFTPAWPVGLEAPVPIIDIRAAQELERAAYESAERTARHGASLAMSMGLQADALVVADEVSVAETLIRVAGERDASAVVVGAHRQGAVSEVLLGSTSRDVDRHAPCPAIVVRDADRNGAHQT